LRKSARQYHRIRRNIVFFSSGAVHLCGQSLGAVSPHSRLFHPLDGIRMCPLYGDGDGAAREGEGEKRSAIREPPGVRQEGRALYFRSITRNLVDPPPRFADSTRSAPFELGGKRVQRSPNPEGRGELNSLFRISGSSKVARNDQFGAR